MSDQQYKILLDAIAVCDRMRDPALKFKAEKASDALSKLFDAAAELDTEREEMAIPF